MFFCIGLVFASATTSNTRVIKGDANPDIIVSIETSDYVISDAVIDPVSKNNIETYVLKDNCYVMFNYANNLIESETSLLNNYYYRTYKNKNLIIRCFDTAYRSGLPIKIVSDKQFAILKATNRLNNCLFVYEIKYQVKTSSDKDADVEDRAMKFYFKIVSEKEYELYKDIDKKPKESETDVIKAPKKKVEK